MDTPKKNIILVPTDFSDVANHALEFAIGAAKAFNDSIMLLFIHDIGNAITSLFSTNLDNPQHQMIHEAAQARYDSLKHEIWDKHNIMVNFTIKDSHQIYKTIVDTAEELECESIIMGSHGIHGTKHIIGTNASRVISHAKIPVVVVKNRPFGEGYKSIVFPVDVHVETRQKISWAIDLAKKFNSTIHVISYKKHDEFLRQMVAGNMHRVEKRFDEAGVKYTVRTLESSAHFEKETIKYAVEINADLILTVTQPESGFAEFIIGSSTQQIVNHSPVPVMTLTPHAIGAIDVPGL